MRALSRLSCLLLLASATAGAANVYKWKDANGVTQYSEKPPAGQKYETREVQTRDPAAPRAAAPVAAAESGECTKARDNLTLLAGKNAVMQDTDGDGKPETALNDDQRGAQKALAEAAIKAYCTPKA